jgi:hypothetical protein
MGLLVLEVDEIPAVVNNLVDGGVTAALSAEQGKILKGQIDSIQIPAVPAVVDNLVDGGASSTLSAEQGKILKQLVDSKPSFVLPQTLNAATALVAANANRQIIYNGPNANLTIQADVDGGFANDEEFQIVTDDASSGIPTLVLPDASAYPGGPNVIVGAVRKGANKWQAYTVSKTPPQPQQGQVVTFQGNNVPIPGDTATNILVAQVIPGGTLGPNGWIECEVYVTRASAGAGNLSLQMHLSSSQFGVATPMSASHLTYRAIRSIFNVGAQNVQRCWPSGVACPNEGGTSSVSGSSGVNTANDLTVYIRSINAAVESAAITLVKWRIRCFYGA